MGELGGLPSFLPFLKINEVSLSPHTAFSGERTHHTFPYMYKEEKRGWMHKISAPATQIERRGRDFSFLPFSRTPHFPLKNSRKRKNPGKCIFLSFPARGSVGEMGVSDLLFPNFIGGGGRKKVRVKSNIFRGKSRKKEKKVLRASAVAAIGKNFKSSRQESEGGSIKFPAKNKGGRFHFSLPGKYYNQNKK